MEINDLPPKEFPPLLNEINDPPKKLRIIGNIPRTKKYLAVVGSRKYSEYGKAICQKLIEELSGYSITIVSGLALGIDSISHKTALKSKLPTIAIPGSGLHPDFLYPSSHINLAKEIVENGGCLISEFSDKTPGYPKNFPQRNRIIAGMSNAVLVIEAELQSGTLITSKYASEYNRDVLTIPNSIFSKTSEGPNMLLKLGATLVTSGKDIIEALGLKIKEEKNKIDFQNYSKDEIEILELLKTPQPRDYIIRTIKKPTHLTQTILASLEIRGIIEETLGEIHLK